MRSYSDCLRPGRLLPVPALFMLVAALGCREDAESPTGPPEPAAPALATGTAAASLVFRAVSAGESHACGVTTDNRVYCWGKNFTGQLGDGTETDHGQPAPILSPLRFLNVSAGAEHTCGVTTTNRAYCWGYAGGGKLGDGTHATIATRPVPVYGGYLFRQVRAGTNHTCGITTFGLGYCWGANGSGQLGNFSHQNRLTPAKVGGGLHWREISPGAYHTCGVATDDRAYCWGRNNEGELGIGTGTAWSRPVAVKSGLLFRRIDGGFFHTCAVTMADRAYCWGQNFSGELGNGTSSSLRATPVAVAGQLQFNSVSAANAHTCGMTLAGRGLCWGWNPLGQLGDGTTTTRLSPTELGGNLSLAQLSAGDKFGCGVTTVGRAYCWGENRYGEVGDGTRTRRLLPVPVTAPM